MERLNDSCRIMLKNVKCGVKLKFQASTLMAGCELLLFHCCFVLCMCISVSIFWLYLNHNPILMVEKMTVAISDVTKLLAACYRISEPGDGMGCKNVPHLPQRRSHLCLA